VTKNTLCLENYKALIDINKQSYESYWQTNHRFYSNNKTKKVRGEDINTIIRHSKNPSHQDMTCLGVHGNCQQDGKWKGLKDNA